MKRFTALLLALLISASALAISAAAEDDDRKEVEGSAGINFTKGEEPGIIPPPDGSGIMSNKLHFGSHKLDNTEKKYDSKDQTVEIDEAQRYAGLWVVNPDREQAWEVTVAMGKFMVEVPVNPEEPEGETEKKETLDGFSLQLIHDGTFKGDNGGAPRVPDMEPLTGNGDSITVLESQNGANAGTFGANYSGELSVLANTADKGEASAIMTWTFQFA